MIVLEIFLVIVIFIAFWGIVGKILDDWNF